MEEIELTKKCLDCGKTFEMNKKNQELERMKFLTLALCDSCWKAKEEMEVN